MNDYISNNPRVTFDKLSNRELQIAHLLAEGQTIMQIAKLLALQIPSVSSYKSKIFQKLDIKNLIQLIQLFNLYNKNKESSCCNNIID